MSKLRKRGKVYYLYAKIKIPNPAYNPQLPRTQGNLPTVYKQVAKAVSESYDVAKTFKENYDHDITTRELGITNKRYLWPDFKEKFLQGYKGSTQRRYTYTFRTFERLMKPTVIAAIDYEYATTWRDKIMKATSERGTPFSNTTINMDIRNLRTTWREAIKFGYATINPFKAIKELPVTILKPRYISLDGVHSIMDAARKSTSKDAPLLLSLFLYTGMRGGEVVGLRWDSVDLDRGLLHIRKPDCWAPKDRAERPIPLNDELVAMLRARPRTGLYVFPGARGAPHRHLRTTQGLINRIYKRCGISASGVHVLRHTLATHSNLPIKVLKEILGHSDVETTMIYAHSTEADMAMVRNFSYFHGDKLVTRDFKVIENKAVSM